MDTEESTSQQISYNGDDFEVENSEPRSNDRTPLRKPRENQVLEGKIVWAAYKELGERQSPAISMLVKLVDDEGNESSDVGMFHTLFLPDPTPLSECEDDEEMEKAKRNKNIALDKVRRLAGALFPDLDLAKPFRRKDGTFSLKGEEITEEKAAEVRDSVKSATVDVLNSIVADPSNVLVGETFFFRTRKNTKGYLELVSPSATIPVDKAGVEATVNYDPDTWAEEVA